MPSPFPRPPSRWRIARRYLRCSQGDQIAALVRQETRRTMISMRSKRQGKRYLEYSSLLLPRFIIARKGDVSSNIGNRASATCPTTHCVALRMSPVLRLDIGAIPALPMLGVPGVVDRSLWLMRTYLGSNLVRSPIFFDCACARPLLCI